MRYGKFGHKEVFVDEENFQSCVTLPFYWVVKLFKVGNVINSLHVYLNARIGSDLTVIKRVTLVTSILGPTARKISEYIRFFEALRIPMRGRVCPSFRPSWRSILLYENIVG